MASLLLILIQILDQVQKWVRNYNVLIVQLYILKQLFKMDNMMIVKKRLKELRSLSESLKVSSKSEFSVDQSINIVKLIIDLTKDVQKKAQTHQLPKDRSPDSPYPNQHQLKYPRLLQQLQKSIEYQQKQKNKEQQIKNKEEEWMYRQEQYKKAIEKDKQQVEELKKQNRRIAELLNNVQQQLAECVEKNRMLEGKMREREIQDEEEEGLGKKANKHLKYYQFNEGIPVFYTQKKLAGSDYPHIKYEIKDIKLGFNYLQLAEANKVIKKFDIQDIHQVHYISDNFIVIKFGQNDDQSSLFLKFNDYQHMHRWDMGIYINLTIAKSLGKQKMFVDTDYHQNSQKQNERKLQKSIKRQKSKDKKEKEKLLQQDALIEQRIQQKIKIFANINEETKLQLKQYYRMLQKTKKAESKLKQCGIYLDRQKQYNSIISSESRHDSQLQKNRLRQEEFRKQQLKKQVQQLAVAKNSLKSGMYMTKYAEGGFNPHEKKVYLSKDESRLCWKDRQGGREQKSELISDIVSVNLGEVGGGIEKHVQKKELGNLKRYVVIKLKGEKRKQLEFGMYGPELMEEFAKYLNIFLRSQQQPHENKEVLF